MLTIHFRLPPAASLTVPHTLWLTAEERTRSRHRFSTEDGQDIQLLLPRGTVLRDGDLLGVSVDAPLVRVRAKPEAVLTVRAADASQLLRAAYHLGNRHVALELGVDYLRLNPDPVLARMLEQLGLRVTPETAAFQPEAGAYGDYSHAPVHGIMRTHG